MNWNGTLIRDDRGRFLPLPGGRQKRGNGAATPESRWRGARGAGRSVAGALGILTRRAVLARGQDLKVRPPSHGQNAVTLGRLPCSALPLALLIKSQGFGQDLRCRGLRSTDSSRKRRESRRHARGGRATPRQAAAKEPSRHTRIQAATTRSHASPADPKSHSEIPPRPDTTYIYGYSLTQLAEARAQTRLIGCRAAGLYDYLPTCLQK